jgi:hypothetical protein
LSKKAMNLLERLVNTAAQAFIGALPVTIPLTNNALSAAGWAGLTAAIAATISLVKNLVSTGAATPQANLVSRFTWTAAQAFLGAIPATFALTVDNGRALALAGITAAVGAVLSLAKNLTAEGVIDQAKRRVALGEVESYTDEPNAAAKGAF